MSKEALMKKWKRALTETEKEAGNKKKDRDTSNDGEKKSFQVTDAIHVSMERTVELVREFESAIEKCDNMKDLIIESMKIGETEDEKAFVMISLGRFIERNQIAGHAMKIEF